MQHSQTIAILLTKLTRLKSHGLLVCGTMEISQTHIHTYSPLKPHTHSPLYHTYTSTTGEYTEFEGKKYSQLVRMSGSPLAKHKMGYGGRHKKLMKEHFGAPLVVSGIQNLPDNFDWRNSTACGSVNCVSPVRNQQSCGSCYIFSAGGSLESRIRIASKGKISTIFSPQDEIGCNPYKYVCQLIFLSLHV